MFMKVQLDIVCQFLLAFYMDLTGFLDRLRFEMNNVPVRIM